MDTLIELIIRGLIALFTGRSDQPSAPPRQVPRIPPIDTIPPANPLQQRATQLTRRPQQAARPQLIRKQPIRPPANSPQLKRPPSKPMRRTLGKSNAPPPIPRPPSVAAAPLPPMPRPAVARATESAAATVATSRTTISAAAIRQLILSRRTAMRTIYVLSEVIGPPVGLR
jgi:hypothetical protein